MTISENETSRDECSQNNCNLTCKGRALNKSTADSNAHCTGHSHAEPYVGTLFNCDSLTYLLEINRKPFLIENVPARVNVSTPLQFCCMLHKYVVGKLIPTKKAL